MCIPRLGRSSTHLTHAVAASCCKRPKVLHQGSQLADEDLPMPIESTDVTAAEDAAEHAPTAPRSRRSFIFFGALAAAGALAPRSLRAQRVATRRRPAPPVQADEFPTILPQESVIAFESWTSDSVRLVRRVTMGTTFSDVMLARGIGYQGYLNRQLNYTKIPDDTTNAVVATKWPLLSQTADQLFSQPDGTFTAQLQEATIYRAAFSQRQLYERMVEFWSDHFNISINKVGYLKLIDDRDVIRKYAMSKVGDLVRASSKSPAMLGYLDQTLSKVGRPNQNYARELMELHTLGVDAGYTQDDVAELSRVLTGWSFQGRGVFVFNPGDHDWGAKTVMGITVPAGSPSLGQAGIKEGEQLIDMLIAHPNTARFIATKMLKWLLTTEPTASQISTIASVYKATGGDIKSMVRAILNDAWLPASPLKFKRPFHFLVSALRSTNPFVASLATMNSQLNNIGQPLFVFETPDGYPDKVEFWAGNIMPRWSFGSTLSGSTSNTSINVDVSRYLAGTADAAIDIMDQEFFGGELDTPTRLALLNYLKGGTLSARIRETLALAMSSSRFQWY
jgi:hypothetical protein